MGSTLGRIVYVEPNNIRANSGINFNNGDNITWNQEDLNIAVDLQVIIPDRDSCGQYESDELFDVNIKDTSGIWKKWQSFMSGENINGEQMLTDSYTDISYQEIRRNNAGGKEALGIQSIDINFDSHFFPLVTMKFIDVRGYSLMQPEEQKYTDQLSRRAETCESFFNALFHFPYPRFALSIKGFYGNRVTFMLSVSEFKSNFNAQTGNFEVTVDFIGHMYGVYSDIPFNYLLIAPYIDSITGGVNEYWRKQTSSQGNFFFSDGVTPIPTFIEFLSKYDNMADEYKRIQESGEGNYENINTVTHIREEQNTLRGLKDKYNSLIDSIGDNGIEFTNLILYFSKNAAIKMPSAEDLNNFYNEYIGNSNFESKIILPESLKNDTNKNDWGIENMALEDPLFDSGNRIKENHNYYQILKKEGAYGDSRLIEWTGKSEYNVYMAKKENGFVNEINKRIEEIDTEVKKLLDDSSAELEEITKKILGFSPTIENVFRMVFAHIDTFSTMFYTLLKDIDNKRSQRTVSNLGIDIRDTDIEASGTNNCFLPPFTAFYKNNIENGKRERQYPTTMGLSDLDEVKFVERIYRGISGANSEIEKARNILDRDTYSNNSEVDEYENGSGEEWKRSSLIDMFYKSNPYSGFSIKAGDDYLSHLLYFFTCRYLATQYTGGIVYEDDRTKFIKNEIENILKYQGERIKNSSEFLPIIDGYITSPQSIVDGIKDTYDNNPSFQFELKFSGSTIECGDNIPLVFYSLRNENGVKYRYEDLEGHGIFSQENSENKYDEIPISQRNIISDYKKNKKFKGFIRGFKKNGDVKKTYWLTDGEDIKKARGDGGKNFYVPYIQVYKDKNLINAYAPNANTLITKKEEPDNIIDRAWYFTASLLGSTDFYRFMKEGSEIRRVPKVVALFLGGFYNHYSGDDSSDDTICKDFPFLIDTDGIFENLNREEGTPLTAITNYTLEELKNIKESKKSSLSQYFLNWANNEFKGIEKSLLSTDLVEVKGINDQCFPIGENEIQRWLIDLLTSNVDIVKINFLERDIFKYQKLNTADIQVLSDFCKELKKHIREEDTVDTVDSGNPEGYTFESSSPTDSSYKKMEAKEEIYYMLKNLYDRWISTYKVNRFLLDSPERDREIASKKNSGELKQTSKVSEYQSFMFIDSFYNDISDKFLVDPFSIYEAIKIQVDSDANRSVLQFITDIVHKNELLFIALPVFNNIYDTNTINDIFTPHTIYDGKKINPRGVGNTYVVMYTHAPSSNNQITLQDKNGIGYQSDFLDIADSTGHINPIDTKSFEVMNTGENYMVPAFGVTFAKQNQMYFKGISVGMDNPRVTDVSIMNTFALAAQESKGATNNSTTVGQNLYSIYSNRAYDCTVEMMGCANIIPTMYFQLNNVPMFKGAYMITSVKHHIENGSMTTSFTGTRVSKNAIPFNKNVIDIETLINKMIQGAEEEDNGTLGMGESGKLTESGKRTTDSTSAVSEGIPGDMPSIENSEVVFNVAAANRATRESHYVSYKDKNTKETFAENRVPFEKDKSFRSCATAVKNFVNGAWDSHKHDGGFYYNGKAQEDLYRKWNYGYNGFYCYQILPKINFKCIKINGDLLEKDSRLKWVRNNCQAGDIAVMRKKTTDPDHYGHICYFDGDIWISDYNQSKLGDTIFHGENDLWVYGSKPENIMIFRYNGERIMPKEYQTVQIFCNAFSKKKNKVSLTIKDVDGTDEGQKIEDVNGNQQLIKFPKRLEWDFMQPFGDDIEITMQQKTENGGYNDITENECFDIQREEGKIILTMTKEKYIDGDITINVSKGKN